MCPNGTILVVFALEDLMHGSLLCSPLSDLLSSSGLKNVFLSCFGMVFEMYRVVRL